MHPIVALFSSIYTHPLIWAFIAYTVANAAISSLPDPDQPFRFYTFFYAFANKLAQNFDTVVKAKMAAMQKIPPVVELPPHTAQVTEQVVATRTTTADKTILPGVPS